MHIRRKITTLTLLLAVATCSVQGQESTADCCEAQASCAESGYMESVHAAHWSIYIPIGVYVAAAIFLGIADTESSPNFAHSRSDALGPADSHSHSKPSRGNYSRSLSSSFSHQ